VYAQLVKGGRSTRQLASRLSLGFVKLGDAITQSLHPCLDSLLEFASLTL
jgi:hypothetical protein